MAEDRIKDLEAKVAELERRLQLPTRMAAADLTPEDLRAYQKVRDVVAADWGEFCGINDCFRCIVVRCGSGPVVRCVVRCINECVCGPCNVGPYGGGSGGGFGGFGS